MEGKCVLCGLQVSRNCGFRFSSLPFGGIWERAVVPVEHVFNGVSRALWSQESGSRICLNCSRVALESQSPDPRSGKPSIK